MRRYLTLGGSYRFGWTGQYESVSIWAPIMAVFVLGFCVLYVFLTGFNYLVS